MSIRFNHTIVHSRDQKQAASFFTEMLGLPAPRTFGPFLVVEFENGASLDFLDADEGEIVLQHYAFLVDEADFDPIFARLRERGLTYWADPYKQRSGENQSPRGRARALLRRSLRPSPRDPHAPVRQLTGVLTFVSFSPRMSSVLGRPVPPRSRGVRGWVSLPSRCRRAARGSPYRARCWRVRPGALRGLGTATCGCLLGRAREDPCASPSPASLRGRSRPAHGSASASRASRTTRASVRGSPRGRSRISRTRAGNSRRCLS